MSARFLEDIGHMSAKESQHVRQMFELYLPDFKTCLENHQKI
jgi:hypothetical protein